MKFLEALDKLKPFAGVAAQFIPGGPAVVAAVNAFLPEDDRLPATATPEDIDTAIDGMPAQDRAKLLEKQIDLKIAEEEGWTQRYIAMANADGQETRAKVVLIMTYMFCVESLLMVIFLYFNPTAVTDSATWTVFGVLTAVPAGIIGKYFGELRREQHARVGHNPAGFMSNIISKLK